MSQRIKHNKKLYNQIIKLKHKFLNEILNILNNIPTKNNFMGQGIFTYIFAINTELNHPDKYIDIYHRRGIENSRSFIDFDMEKFIIILIIKEHRNYILPFLINKCLKYTKDFKKIDKQFISLKRISLKIGDTIKWTGIFKSGEMSGINKVVEIWYNSTGTRYMKLDNNKIFKANKQNFKKDIQNLTYQEEINIIR